VHLVGFIIRIYHDARSPERLYSKNKFEKLVPLVGFIIRIYHDARSPERLYSKNKFKKSMHLVGFIIRTRACYHSDKRSRYQGTDVRAIREREFKDISQKNVQ